MRPVFSAAPELIAEQTFNDIKRITGAAYVPETGHYLLVSSKPDALHEISRTLKTVRELRTVRLKGFEKVSGMAYLGTALSGDGTRIALIEEGRGSVSFCDLGSESQVLKRESCGVYPVDKFWLWEKKSGLQGVAVDSGGDVPLFYFGKEKLPRRIYRGYFEDGSWHVKEQWDADSIMDLGSRISDLAFYKSSLFILDGKTAEIFQMDPLTGQSVSRFRVPVKKEARSFTFAKQLDRDEMLVTSGRNRILIFGLPVEKSE